MSEQLPDFWLRGPVDGIIPELQPVAHALLQVAEDIQCARELPPELLWLQPGGAASVGFHLKHLAGSAGRLFTYAQGRQLDEEQRRFLSEEKTAGTPATADELITGVHAVIEQCLSQLRATQPDTLHQRREVGRAKLPSTTFGLLFHATEHAQRHVGQIVATTRILRGMRPSAQAPGK